MKKIMFFAAALLFALASVSCEKDEYSPSAKRLLPSEVIEFQSVFISPDNSWSSKEIWQFEYDSENRISKLKYEFTRNGESLMTTMSTFSYNGDDITIEKVRTDIESSPYVVSYVREGSVIKEIGTEQQKTINIDNKSRSEDHLYDKNGNMQYYDGGTLRYDRENGVFRNVNMPAWYLTEIFNCPLGSCNLYNNRIESNRTTGSDYIYTNQYNTDNYPVQIASAYKELVIGGGSGSSYKIEYIEAN